MNITVIGGGRVGLPTAVALATLGHDVVCCERNTHRRQMAAKGQIPFTDKGLEYALATSVQSGRLRFCANVAFSVKNAKAAIITVPVASGKAGLNELKKVTATIATVSNCVLIVKSTVPPGTCEQLRQTYGICIVANPEFLRQGNGFEDCMSPTRIVVGVNEARARRLLRTIYSPLIAQGTQYIETSCISAEIAKLASNTFLAERVALINETADLCEATGGDINDVAHVLAADQRIGSHYLCAGVGFGGTCLPKDGRLLLETGKSVRIDMPTTEAIFISNRRRIQRIAERIIAQSPRNAVVAIWGAAFKPDADSICESPAVEIMRLLDARGIRLQVCDPLLDATALQKVLPNAIFFEESVTATINADVLAILNRQQAFLRISATTVMKAMRGKMVFDYAGVFKHAACRRAGLTLRAVGVSDNNND